MHAAGYALALADLVVQGVLEVAPAVVDAQEAVRDVLDVGIIVQRPAEKVVQQLAEIIVLGNVPVAVQRRVEIVVQPPVVAAHRVSQHVPLAVLAHARAVTAVVQDVTDVLVVMSSVPEVVSIHVLDVEITVQGSAIAVQRRVAVYHAPVDVRIPALEAVQAPAQVDVEAVLALVTVHVACYVRVVQAVLPVRGHADKGVPHVLGAVPETVQIPVLTHAMRYVAVHACQRARTVVLPPALPIVAPDVQEVVKAVQEVVQAALTAAHAMEHANRAVLAVQEAVQAAPTVALAILVAQAAVKVVADA